MVASLLVCNFVLNLQLAITATTGRSGGLITSALDSGSSGPGSSPGGGLGVAFLGKTLHSIRATET